MRTIFTAILTCALFCSGASDAWSWAGYEEASNAQIDIPPGTTVKIGHQIDIYDLSDQKYHPSEVIFLDDIFVGTRLEVRDLETNKKRIFYMERS